MALWLVKALVQKALSGLPGGNRVNYMLQQAAGSRRSARVHARVPRILQFLAAVQDIRPIHGADIFEIGTGWDAINALLLSLLGARRITTVDHVAHLRLREARVVLDGALIHADLIATIGEIDPRALEVEIQTLRACATIDELLHRARIDYRAPEDALCVDLPVGSFDIVYTYAVLAHLPEQQLPMIAQVAKRLLRNGGIVAHRIGLQDPFNSLRNGNSVNFLRYSDRTWGYLNSSIQSNNRVRASQHIRHYAEAGALIVLSRTEVDKADLISISKMRVASRFDGLPPEDLAAHALNLICKF